MREGRRAVLSDRGRRASAGNAPPSAIAAGVAIGVIGLIGAAVAIGAALRRVGEGGQGAPGARPAAFEAVARRLDRASSLLAVSALADSALEHYRGSFHNKFMYVPIGVSAATLAAGLCGSAGVGGVPRSGVHRTAIATGIVGTGFHIYNITKRPGGISWLNLFYAAPLGAPAALSLAGLLGMASRLLHAGEGTGSGALLARLVSVALVGTTGEAALLHFRGAYHNPAMTIPIVMAPTAAGLLASTAQGAPARAVAARWALRLLAGIGFVGAGFHAYGIQRNMGGWRNWSQTLLNGPPLPAPPSFTALALAGLAALQLIEGQKT